MFFCIVSHTCHTYDNKSYYLNIYMDCKQPKLKVLGVVSVGVKGQIVIPKEIRDTLGITPGKKFIALLKDNKYLGFVDHENMEDLKNYLDNE